MNPDKRARLRGSGSATPLPDDLESLQDALENADSEREFDELAAVYHAKLHAAALPIVEELQAVGYDVENVDDLGSLGTPYPDALPVLMRHLRQGGYPEQVMESIVRNLGVRDAAPWWGELKEMYLTSRDEDMRDALALALAEIATKEHLEELISMVTDPGLADRLGYTRDAFLRPIRLIGRDRGLDVIETLVDDPTMGREATAQLAKSKRRKSAKRRSNEGVAE